MGSGLFYTGTGFAKKNLRYYRLMRSLFFAGVLLLSMPLRSGAQTTPVPLAGNTIVLSACENNSIDISSYLTVTDPDPAQDEIFSVSSTPSSGGSISGLPVTLNTGAGGTVSIAGVVYTPPSGFSGSDYFQIQVDNGADGTIYYSFFITINGAPALTLGTLPSVCTGSTSSSLPYSALTNVGLVSVSKGAIGYPDAFIVPVGVNTIYFDIAGGVGGSDNVSGATNGGKGACVQGALAVNPNDQLNIYVGVAGANGSAYGAAGGFNGGGNAFFDPANGCGGGGGGASDIRVGGFALSNRVAVAGGGAGGGNDFLLGSMNGGDGGDVNGIDGTPNSDGSFATGGSQVGAGTGATYTGYTPGNPGVNNIAGDGSSQGVSGGGGGGYFGGGGGIFNGGGGGSSYTDPLMTSSVTVTPACNSGSGYVTLSYNTVGSYTITYDATAQSYGFANVPAASIPAGNFPIIVPAGAPAAFYNATLTISNGVCSTDYPFTVEVKQTPDVMPVSSEVHCDGDLVNIPFTTSLGTSPTYDWVNSNTAIGAPAIGSGTLSFTAANSTSGPLVGVFTVTPTEFGCVGQPTSFAVTTNPLPMFTLGSNPEICSGVTSTSVSFSNLINIGSYSNTYSFLGGNPNPQSFIVPDGITSISFDMVGAIGGSDDVSPSPNPGKGARAQGVLNVSPFQTLYFYVGGRGFNGSVFGAAGGYNGGGNAYYYPGVGSAGGGGGASDIRVNGQALTDRAVVAGGGGGNGWDNFFGAYAGGVGGGLTGGNSQANKDGVISGGGNQVAGGTGATYSGGWIPGSNGTLGLGGYGSIQGISGGGGGGYYGGGGGMWNGGGGGSSYNDPVTTTLVTHTPGYNNGNGSIVINYTTIAMYSIDYDPVAEGQGFVDVASTTLPSSSFPVTVPANALPGTYNATVTISNGICSNTYPFTVTVDPLPTVDPTTDQTICNGDMISGVTFTGSIPGTVFHWTNDDPTIGIAAVDSVDISSVTGTNAGTAPAVANFIVMPVEPVTGCVGVSDTFVITVNPTPKLNSSLTPAAYCSNTAITYNATSATSGTTFDWSRDLASGISNAANTGSGDPNETLVDTFTYPAVAIYQYALEANGCKDTEYVNVTINPTPVFTSKQKDTVCSGDLFVYTPASATTGTTYAWQHNSPAGSTVPAMSGTGGVSEMQGSIAPVMINVLFTFTLTANGCDNHQNVNLFVKPIPKLSSAHAMPDMCSGSMNSYTPTSATPGADLKWDRSMYAPILEGGNTNSGVINETLTNVTTLPFNVPYRFQLSADGCSAPDDTVWQMVNPIPVMTSTRTPAGVCSGTPFMYNFASSTPGTTFSWIRPVVSGVTTTSGSFGTGTINQTFTDTTSKPVKVDYLVTVDYASCTSNDTVHAMINPTPKITSSLADTSICDSFGMGKYMILSNVNGATFMWSRDYVSGISNVGTTGTTNFINEGLANTTNVDVTTVYTITPSANGCVGASVTRNVTVHPTPRLSSTLTPHYVCSDFPFYYHPTSYVDGTTFDWKRDTVNGISPATSFGSGDVWGGDYNTLVATDFKYHYVTYKFRLSANGCINQFYDQVKLLVNPAPKLPAISTNTPNGPCSNMMFQTFDAAAPPDAGVQFDWSATNAQVWSSTANHQHAYVNFNNPGTSFVIMKGTILATGCIYKDSIQVNVGYGVADAPRIIYHQGQFICLQSDMDSYQWGCDDIETFASTEFQGANLQNYYLPNADFQHKRYWVMTIHNGCKQKSYFNAPTAVNEVNADFTDVRVFPNPTQDNINVEINSSIDGTMTVDVVNMLGQKLNTADVVNRKASIDVSNLAAGCYVVDCYRNGVKIATSRFIKN